MSNNIDTFNEGTALVFEKLYETFPIGIKLTARELKPGMDEQVHAIFCGAVVFLVDEGFIRCESNRGAGMALDGARLTSKGLATLSLTPESIAGNAPTLMDKIKAAIKDGGKQGLNAVITQTIAAFIKIGIG